MRTFKNENEALECALELYPKEHTGTSLFYLDFKNGNLNVDYDKIWSFLEQNYSNNYQDITDLIKGWLNEDDKLKVLTPHSWIWMKLNVAHYLRKLLYYEIRKPD